MSRGFPSAVLTALSAQHVVLVTFAKLEFPSGTLYVHNSIGTYTWGGQDWLGTGDLGEISAIEEGADVSPYKITLSLSGLDPDVSAAALTEDYYLQPVTVSNSLSFSRRFISGLVILTVIVCLQNLYSLGAFSFVFNYYGIAYAFSNSLTFFGISCLLNKLGNWFDGGLYNNLSHDVFHLLSLFVEDLFASRLHLANVILIHA